MSCKFITVLFHFQIQPGINNYFDIYYYIAIYNEWTFQYFIYLVMYFNGSILFRYANDG